MADYETKDYEVVQFKAGTFMDNYQNYWCDMALKGISEPVRIAVKDPTQFHDGMVLYGTIDHAKSKSNKPYLRFKRIEKKEESAPASLATDKAASGWSHENPERQDSINRSVALNDAALVYQGTGVAAESITEMADAFYAWLRGPVGAVNDVFGADTVHDVKDEPINLEDIPY